MQRLPSDWVNIFEHRLAHAKLPQPEHAPYLKWARFYLTFCRKFGYPATAPTALGPFLTKLAEKNFSIQDRHHAANAVRLLLRYDPQQPGFYLDLSVPAPLPASADTNPIPGQTLSPQSRAPTAAPTASWEREYRELQTEIKLRNYSPKPSTFTVSGSRASKPSSAAAPPHISATRKFAAFSLPSPFSGAFRPRHRTKPSILSCSSFATFCIETSAASTV